MTIIASLTEVYKKVVASICTEMDPSWNDDQYHPTVNYVAEKTGWHPAWIEDKLNQGLERHLRETGSRETLDDVTPRTIIKYLNSIPDGNVEISKGAPPSPWAAPFI